MVTQMMAVGEETGAVDEMLDKIADFYDPEIEATVPAVTSLIEPLLIVVMGAWSAAWYRSPTYRCSTSSNSSSSPVRFSRADSGSLPIGKHEQFLAPSRAPSSWDLKERGQPSAVDSFIHFSASGALRKDSPSLS